MHLTVRRLPYMKETKWKVARILPLHDVFKEKNLSVREFQSTRSSWKSQCTVKITSMMSVDQTAAFDCVEYQGKGKLN